MFFYSDFRSALCFLPVFDAYKRPAGILLILSFARMLMGPLLSTRLASSALPMADGARCFYAYYLCGELVKTARADVMISVRQSISQSIFMSRLVPLPVPRVVERGGAIVACSAMSHFRSFLYNSGSLRN